MRSRDPDSRTAEGERQYDASPDDDGSRPEPKDDTED